MSLSALPVALIVPPLNGAPLCVCGLLLRRWRFGRVLAWVGALEVLLLSLPVVSGLLVASLEQGLPLQPPPGSPPGAVVVLGGERVRAVDGTEAPGPLTLERLATGAGLARAQNLPILVTGGSGPTRDVPLATLMDRSLRAQFGTAARWLDLEAEDTRENAARAAALLRPAGVRSVWVVTQGWHERRALLAFRRVGLTATAAPVRLEGASWRSLDDWLPRASAWQDSFDALHEWIGILADPLRPFPSVPEPQA